MVFDESGAQSTWPSTSPATPATAAAARRLARSLARFLFTAHRSHITQISIHSQRRLSPPASQRLYTAPTVVSHYSSSTVHTFSHRGANYTLNSAPSSFPAVRDSSLQISLLVLSIMIRGSRSNRHFLGPMTALLVPVYLQLLPQHQLIRIARQ